MASKRTRLRKLLGKCGHPHLSTTRDEKSRLSSTLSVSSPHPKRPNSSGGGHFDFALCDSNSVLQLVVEYNGTGHYGQNEKEKQEAQSRDSAKRRICWKAGVPIFARTSEFAFVDDYKALLRTLLQIFRTSYSKVDPKFLHDCVSDVLHAISPEQLAASRLDITFMRELAGRLEIYRVQRRADMLLALLRELYFALSKRKELAAIMDEMRKHNGL